MGGAGAIVRPVSSTDPYPRYFRTPSWRLSCWENSALAQAVDEPTAPRRALQAALTAPELLDARRPFIHAEPVDRVHQRGTARGPTAILNRP